MKYLREKIQFLSSRFRKAVQEHELDELENYSIFWLLTFSVIFLPNIMQIGQCFREL